MIEIVAVTASVSCLIVWAALCLAFIRYEKWLRICDDGLKDSHEYYRRPSSAYTSYTFPFYLPALDCVVRTCWLHLSLRLHECNVVVNTRQLREGSCSVCRGKFTLSQYLCAPLIHIAYNPTWALHHLQNNQPTLVGETRSRYYCVGYGVGQIAVAERRSETNGGATTYSKSRGPARYTHSYVWDAAARTGSTGAEIDY